MNHIIGYYDLNGEPCSKISDSKYTCIKLLGEHANDNNSNILVSTEDLPVVLEYKWYLGKNNYPVTYSDITGKYKFGKGLTLHKLLHPVLIKGMVVDHKNRDKLDNRRENLRICTPQQNSYNRSRVGSNYKGVYKSGKLWKAQITKNNKTYTINDIGTEKEAAKMYDMMAEDLFGSYAGKNYPDSW